MSKENLNFGGRDIVAEERAILRKEIAPRDALECQMVLAEELYSAEHHGADLNNPETKNEIMFEWTDKNKHQNGSYSEAYRKLISHPRFDGDPLKVSLNEVEYYLEHQSPL